VLDGGHILTLLIEAVSAARPLDADQGAVLQVGSFSCWSFAARVIVLTV